MTDGTQLIYDGEGLIPCIIQDARTAEVLMLGWMNRESLELTNATGEIHFWSRSRGEIWHKGATSGNRFRLIEIRFDCDADALLALVEPAGPACHTGERSCFFTAVDGTPSPIAGEILAEIERTLEARKATRPEESYSVTLFDDPDLAGSKVTEEAEEVVRAVASESDERVAEEAADLLFHLQVVLA
ncbi:MAG: bifunctional phosphoribosyl-AMP cyclohydrolase/phosphoribosyl-ATP diphosphatase HisIE, partial [bacterium]